MKATSDHWLSIHGEKRLITAQETAGDESAIRNPNPALAALASIVGPGLGYLYVDRPVLAPLPFLGIVGSVAVAGWTRLIIEPAGIYLTYFLVVLIWLLSIIHPVAIARKSDGLAVRPFNRGWVYVLWIVGFGFIGSQFTDMRAQIFGFEPFRIPSSSMEPTVRRNDRIMVDTWRYRDNNPQINEIAVFDVPGSPGTKYQFRIVGLPGDTIEIRDDVLIRNGLSVTEMFIQVSDAPSAMLSDFEPILVPEAHYFLLGDNRHNARDSRFIGPIHLDDLHGRVEYRWFAINDGISWSRFPARLTNAGE